jgi:hypothetical protein
MNEPMREETNDQQESGAAHPKAISTRASYEIRVKNHLDPCWRQRFEGWSLTNLGNGQVILSRSNVDHIALHSTLNKIRDLNLTLLSVIRTEEK